MFLRGLAKLLPLIIHEIAEVIIERIKERRERKSIEQHNKEN
jgi:hypothetical protein